ncbi:hypothetical protein CHUAL_013978 [Chamberlinius hualienensis]
MAVYPICCFVNNFLMIFLLLLLFFTPCKAIMTESLHIQQISLELQHSQLAMIQLLLYFARLFRLQAIQKTHQATMIVKCMSMFNFSRKRRKYLSVGKAGMWWDEIVPQISARKFKQNFRVTRITYLWLVSVLRDELTVKTDTLNDRFKDITVEKRVAVGLFVLGSNSKYKTVAQLFGIDKTTVGKVILDFCRALIKIITPNVVKYPTTLEEFETLQKKFENSLPQCIGVIGACHINARTDLEVQQNDEDINNLVLLAVCDFSGEFWYVNCSSSINETYLNVFGRSILAGELKTNPNFHRLSRRIDDVSVPLFISGNSSFPLMKTLMKPYSDKLKFDEMKRQFNCRINRCLETVECAFDHLISRFRCLSRSIEFVSCRNDAQDVVYACCTLHNLCKKKDDRIELNWVKNFQKSEVVYEKCEDENEIVRDALATHLFRSDIKK